MTKDQNKSKMKFDLPKDRSAIIKVIGVGGGGSNAVNYMYNQGIAGVDFIVCNTDHQSLDNSPVPTKLQLGASLTEGLGAGSIPEVGKNAAIENVDDLKELLGNNTKMVFVTAGMGGGTGTGAAPVIAKAAKEQGILTVGIVTVPFAFEGKKRLQQAEAGIKEIRDCVDTLLIINNDKLRDLYGNLGLTNAFAHADDVLTTAAKGIAEVITHSGIVNVDFQDVRTVMNDSGVALMGSAQASGEDRAICAAAEALASPLLNDNDISGANYILLNISFGEKEVLMDEVTEITNHIQEAAGQTADVIWGYGQDSTLGEELRVTLIATGFHLNPDTGVGNDHLPKKKVMDLDAEVPSKVTEPITSPTATGTTPQNPNLGPQSEEEAEPFLVTRNEEQTTTESQTSIEFEVNTPRTPDEQQVTASKTPTDKSPESTEEVSSESEHPVQEKVVHKLEEIPPQKETPEDVQALHTLSPEEQQERSEKRISSLKEMNMKLRTPNGLVELEQEPAFKRRGVKLDEIPHSSESQLSKYTLGESNEEDGERRTGLRPDNPFTNPEVD